MKMDIRYLFQIIIVSSILLTGCTIKNGSISTTGEHTSATRSAIITQTQLGTPSAQPHNRVDISIDFGDGIISSASAFPADTVFAALDGLAKEMNLDVKTKQYDFGILVEKIGQSENTTDKAWMYYVNGSPGNVAGDKYELKTGDRIEWKYEKPTF